MQDIKAQIMTEAAMQRTILRIAHEIVEKNEDGDICFVGIHRRGVPLAKQIAEAVSEFTGRQYDVGSVDITLYRDDLTQIAQEPTVLNTGIDFPVVGRTVILVDDVIYTGRTIRAAIDAVLHIARPAKIQLAVMVDRGHRELPIRADYVGKNVPTSKNERVCVCLPEYDGLTGVLLYDF